MEHKKYLEIVDLVNKWSHEYYVLDNPTVTDEQYDANLSLLIEFEKQSPQLKSENTPTQRVGDIVLDKFDKFEHRKPMLSLSNAFNFDDLIKFDSDMKKISSEITYVGELKIDGLSAAVHYDNGVIKYGATRGTGIIGELVTNNMKTIKTLPLSIKDTTEVEVRGEIFISKSNFKKINLNSNKKFANPRNLASGSIRQLDSKVAAERKLDIQIFDSITPDLPSHWETIERLRKNNLCLLLMPTPKI